MGASRRVCLKSGFALAMLLPLLARSQPAAGTHRIGFLALRFPSTKSRPDELYDAFVEGMRDKGYIEGKNLHIEWRYAHNDAAAVPALAKELVHLEPEILVTHFTPGALTLRRLTTTIPIVMTACNDPIGSGLAVSISHPGGNVTGMSLLTTDLGGKQLEVMKQLMPDLRRIAVLINPVNNASHVPFVQAVSGAAGRLGVEVSTFSASSEDALRPVFAQMASAQIRAVIVTTDAFFTGQMAKIAAIADANGIASIYAYEEYPIQGGLVSYGLNILDSHRRAASYVDKIFKGAKPAELPFEQPMSIRLGINKRVAAHLNLQVPQQLLVRADRVVEQ